MKPTAVDLYRYDEALRWLELKRAKMSREIARLGRVIFTDEIPTARVRMYATEICLDFNPEWYRGLKIAGLSTVILHETLHVLLAHERRAGYIDNRHERMIFLRYAIECVVNDSIKKYYGNWISWPGNPIFGEDILGYSTADMSAEQVLAELLEMEDELPMFGIGEGLVQTLDDHDVFDADNGEGGGTLTSAENSNRMARDQLIDGIIEQFVGSDSWGREKLGQVRAISKEKPCVDLLKFLTMAINQEIKLGTTWTRPNKKAISIYPGVILPVYEKEENRYDVLCAIDASGSMCDKALSVCTAIVRQKMPGVNITAVSFDAEVFPMDTPLDEVRGGERTDFQKVEEHVLGLKRYPDKVFLLTDGYAEKPTLKFPKKWCWVLTPIGDYKSAPKGVQITRCKY